MSEPSRYVSYDPHRVTIPHAPPIPRWKWVNFRPFLQSERQQGSNVVQIVMTLKQKPEAIEAAFAPTPSQLNRQFGLWKREEDGRSEAATPRSLWGDDHISMRAERLHTLVKDPRHVPIRSPPDTPHNNAGVEAPESGLGATADPSPAVSLENAALDQVNMSHHRANSHPLALVDLNSNGNSDFAVVATRSSRAQPRSTDHNIDASSAGQCTFALTWVDQDPSLGFLEQEDETGFFEDAARYRGRRSSLPASLDEHSNIGGLLWSDEELAMSSIDVDGEVKTTEATKNCKVCRSNSLPTSVAESMSAMSISVTGVAARAPEIELKDIVYAPSSSGSRTKLIDTTWRTAKSAAHERANTKDLRQPAKLSGVAEEFVKRKSESLSSCWPYLQYNRELLSEPPEAFLSAAIQANRRGRTEAARDYVDCLNLINAYHSLAGWVFEPFLQDLVAGNGAPPFHARQKNIAADFMSSCDKVMQQLRQSQDSHKFPAGMSSASFVASLAVPEPVKLHRAQSQWL